MKLVFATHNRHKLDEVRAALGPGFELLTPADCGLTDEIPEDQDTLEGNAAQKAHFIHDRTGLNCFADDTGLEVTALGGEPGIYSARYAGPDCNPDDNIDLLLARLEDKEDRSARFRTVIALLIDGREYLFEGRVDGEIMPARSPGAEGFGYDPVFRPEGYEQTFAQMPLDEKNRISHRGRAVAELAAFLAAYAGNQPE